MALIDVEIDQIASSIVYIANARTISTAIIEWTRLTESSCESVRQWKFDWYEEVSNPDRTVAGLLAAGQVEIQGLISFEHRSDHVLVHLLENAPHNVGRHKRFKGIAANLMAYVCWRSVQAGYDGFVAFDAKSNLISHYEKTLGARRVGTSARMIY